MREWAVQFAVVLAVVASGCATSAVGPQASAARGIMDGSVADAVKRAEGVMESMDIQLTGVQDRDFGKGRQLTGKLYDIYVIITLSHESSSTTRVEVDASAARVSNFLILNFDSSALSRADAEVSKAPVSDYRGLAQEVLNNIVRRG